MIANISLVLVDASARILYTCSKMKWLEMSIEGTCPAILGFLLLIGFPLWLGTRCESCSQCNIFLAGMLFNAGAGIASNVVAVLQWQFFLTKCMPAIYATSGGWQAIAFGWLVLPIETLLGGIAAWIGHKWITRLDKKALPSKRR